MRNERLLLWPYARMIMHVVIRGKGNNEDEARVAVKWICRHSTSLLSANSNTK